MDNEFRHTGVYRGMAPLSREALAYMAVQDNPFLAEMMQRQDSRKWEQDQAIAAARALPKFSPAPTGGSSQIGYQNQMRADAENMIRSENPTVQKQGFAMLDIVNKDLSSNFVETQDQKNAYSAAPNNPQGFQALMAKITDPGYALNLAHRNRMTEMGQDYGNKRGLEQLQFGNKKDLAGFEQGLKGFGTAPLVNGVNPTVDPSASGLTGKTLEIYNKKLAEAQAGAVIGLPAMAQVTDEILTSVNQLKNHPGTKELIGPAKSWGGIPTYVGGNPVGDAAAAQSLIDQILGQSFTQVVTALRGSGLGALSDAEGKKLGDAKVRMQTAQNEKDFFSALTNYEASINRSYTLLENASKGNFKPERVNKGETEPPMTFKSEVEFNDYATKNNLTKEQFIQEYQKHFGGQ